MSKWIKTLNRGMRDINKHQIRILVLKTIISEKIKYYMDLADGRTNNKGS